MAQPCQRALYALYDARRFVIESLTRSDETNTFSSRNRCPDLADVCAAQRKRTQSSPVCGLCPRTVLHHAQLRRRKGTCLTDDLHLCAVRSDRKHPMAASKKG